MHDFFVQQLDYVFFVYGFAFLLFFPICFGLHKNNQTKIPWLLLGLFGLINGFHGWLEMLSISQGDSAPLQWLRWFFLTLSFVCLFEFGRSTCDRYKLIRIKRWVYVPLILGVLFGGKYGIVGLNVMLRYSFGFTGGVLTAVGLWKISRQNHGRSTALSIGSVALMVYAFAAGIFVPKAPFPPALWINQESFFGTLGFPIQIIRTALACVAGFAVWFFGQERTKERVPSNIRKWSVIMGAGLSLLFILGWVWTDHVGNMAGNVQRRWLLEMTEQVSMTINPEVVEQLTGSPADVENPAYQTLKDKLQHLRSALTAVRFIYLMRTVDGKVVFLVDSESPGSKDESPPGQIYDEATPILFKAFTLDKGVVDVPSTDRWGTWISSYVPLNDRRTGKIVAVLGLDRSVPHFNQSIMQERLTIIFFIGLLSLVVLLLFVYWQILTLKIEQSLHTKISEFFVHWGVACIVLLFGVTLTFAMFIELRRSAWEAFHRAFLQHAVNRSQNISQELNSQIHRLEGVSRFINADEVLDRDEFTEYVEPILRNFPIKALQWSPRVKREERERYEQIAREEGITGYRMFEKDADGKKIALGERGEYFPVFFLNPLKENEFWLGFDMGSEVALRTVMEKSILLGKPLATPPLEVSREGKRERVFLLFIPSYRRVPITTADERKEALKGFVVAVYDVEGFLKKIYSNMPAEGLSSVVEDLSVPKDKRVLYRYLPEHGADWLHPIVQYQMPLEMPGRQWRLVIVPGTEFIAEDVNYAYWWIWPLGIFFTSLMAVFSNFMATSRFRAEMLVKLRTQELNKEKEALFHSEERFRNIAEGSGEFIWEVDSAGLYTYASPIVEKMYGYKPDEIVGQKYFYDFFYPDEKDRLIKEIFDGFKAKAEFREVLNPIVHRDGRKVLLSTNAIPIVNDKGDLIGYRGVDRDITVAKEAEEALRKREAYLRSSLDNFPYLVWLKNFDGRFLSVNKVFADACGRSVQDVIGKTDFDVWPPEFAERYCLEDVKVIRHKKKSIVEELIKDGAEVRYFETYKSPVFDNEGNVIGTTGFSRDITERKKAEQALKESEERYRKITSSMTDYIYSVKIENGKAVSTTYSLGCLPVTGYRPEDFLEKPSLWSDIIVESDRRLVQQQIHEVFSGKMVQPIEHRIHHKEGHVCWVSNTIVPQYNKNGELISYDGLIADISERKRAEETLQQAKETAEKALAIKDEFTSTVSHELRTPLAAIKSSIDILDTGVPGQLNDDQKVFIKRVKANIDRLARLINDILDLSKLESGRMMMNLLPLRVENMIQDVVEMQRPLLKNKGLNIETDVAKNLPMLVADKDRLIQVLSNLINNAVKFTKEGKITVWANYDGQKGMAFGVRDTGIGIKQDDLSKLFQKFQQVGGSSQHVGGTGLGLAICKQIVTRHGGQIGVESQFGAGSTFYFTIPLRKEKRILIVDDDEATIKLLTKIIEGENVYEIETANDGFAAGQKYNDFNPHLIVLDIKLPKADGLQMCSRIKNDPKTKQTKIILVSSFATDMQKKEAWSAGADEIINKPINCEELIAKIRKHINV